ncbi:MAG: hypothetical protein HOE80_00005, partial [Candidatus Magasanikbacteria bacterium]|nr:hypothetical protein [Candidatus Magasanikbacteria bacterium]
MLKQPDKKPEQSEEEVHTFVDTSLDTPLEDIPEKKVKKKVAKKKIKKIKKTVKKKVVIKKKKRVKVKEEELPVETLEESATSPVRAGMEDDEDVDEEKPEDLHEVEEFFPEKENTKKENKIDDELLDIYKNKDGSLPDMSQFQVRKSSRLLRAFSVLLLSVVFLSVVAWVGFFVFQPPSSFSEESIILSISGEEAVTPGEEVRYRLRYRNDQGRTLSKAVLQVRYPSGFEFKESTIEPSNESNDEWVLGTVGAHDSGYIDIYGKMYGDIGEAQSFRVFLNYYPENFHSEFQKVATANITISDAPYTMEVIIPDNIIAGIEVPIEIVVTKLSDAESISGDVQLLFSPDNVFIKTKSEPASDEFYPYRWTVPADVETYTVMVYGSFEQSGDGADAVLPIRLEMLPAQGADPFVYVEEKITTALADDIDISIIPAINGSMHDFSVQPGEVLLASMVVRNNGKTTLENIRVRGVYEAPSYNKRSMLRWGDYEDSVDGLLVGEQVNDQYRLGIMTWDERHIPDLARLAPGEEVTIDVSVPIQNSTDITLTNFTASKITFSTDMQYKENGEQKVLSGTPIVMTLNSDVSLDVRDDVEVGDSSFDNHAVTWVLGNTFHELKDITLSAEVFGNTLLEESSFDVPAGEIDYNSDKKKITWTVDSMPIGLDVLALSFLLERQENNPSQTYLMSKVIGTATDTTTGEEITLIFDEILLNE